MNTICQRGNASPQMSKGNGPLLFIKKKKIAERVIKSAESLRKKSVSDTTLKTRKKKQWKCYVKICKNLVGVNIHATQLRQKR